MSDPLRPHIAEVTSAQQAGPVIATACSDCQSVAVAAERPYQFVYAIGRLEVRFPSVGVEKEFAQLAGDPRFTGVADLELVIRVLRQPENAYLARHMCWVLVVQGVDAMSVVGGEHQTAELVDAAEPEEGRLVVIVGEGRPGGCLGPSILEVQPTQILAFTANEFANRVGEVANEPNAKADNAQEEHRRLKTEAVRDIINRTMRRSGNFGISPEHRALNYVVLRYPAIHEILTRAYKEGQSLQAIDTRHTHLGGRLIVEVHIVLRNRRADLITRYMCRVDATEIFPFLVSPFEQIFDH